jgi:hypothetical protein
VYNLAPIKTEDASYKINRFPEFDEQIGEGVTI